MSKINLHLPINMCRSTDLLDRVDGLYRFTQHAQFRPGSMDVQAGLDCFTFFAMAQMTIFRVPRFKLQSILDIYEGGEYDFASAFGFWQKVSKPRNGDAVIMTPRSGSHYHVGCWIEKNVLHFTANGPHFEREDRVPLLNQGARVIEYRRLDKNRRFNKSVKDRLIDALEDNAAGK